MTDKETEMFTAAILASETNSLSGNDEGCADKGTNTDQLESNAPKRAHVVQAHRDTGIVELNDSPDDRTLREIFNRNKSDALDCATRLTELIPDLELDGLFDDDPATDDNRPMRSLLLARQLCDALETLECLKLIMAKEEWV